MQFEEKGFLLTATSNPYDVNGNKGISHKVRVSINGEVYSCSSNAETVASLKGLEGQSGTVKLKITSPKEMLKATLISFES